MRFPVRPCLAVVAIVGALILGACNGEGGTPSRSTVLADAFGRPGTVSDPGDATEEELALLFQVEAAWTSGNDIEMSSVFTDDGVFDTGSRGVWAGPDEITAGSKRSSAIYYLASLRDFTRMGDRLVFNWQLNGKVNSQSTGQGVEARFAQDRIEKLEVTSPNLPYCLGDTLSGCKDYDTGQVIPLDIEEVPLCGPGVNGTCRLP